MKNIYILIMSYNVANFGQVTQSDGVDGIIQLSDGNLGFKGANNVTINTYGDITANAIFAYGAGGGGGGPSTDTLSDVVNRGNVVSNSIVVYGNITANYFLGNANLLSNIVNSDVTPGVYGNGTAVSQITIGSNHRITSISNVLIDQSNLDQVVNRGNVTSNSIEVMGLKATSLTTSRGVVFCTPSSNTLTTSSNIVFDDTLGIMTINGGNGGLIARVVQYINKFTSAVVRGNAIYITEQGGNLNGDLANNHTEANMPAAGLAMFNYAHNSSGYIVHSGEIAGISDAVFTTPPVPANIGKAVYVDMLGKLTFTKPSNADDIRQNIGILTKAAENNNAVLVQGAGQFNDSPPSLLAVTANIWGQLLVGNVSSTGTTMNVLGNAFVSKYYLGNANLLSNTVNSDIVPGVYGNATAVSQITIGSDHRITSISNVVIAQSNLDQVVNSGNVTSNSITANYFLGNANLLSNIVNSDIVPGVYGSATTVSQITIGPDHRINAISSVSITGAGGSSNLDQVANLGNVTSNSLIMSNLLVGNTATVSNIVVTNARGANPTLITGNVLVVDQNFKSYKTFRVLTFASNRLEGIELSNTVDGCQTFIDIYPQSNIIDVFQNLSHGTGTTLLQSYTANLYINSLAHGIISCLTDNGNTFININTYI